jgi:hypothetical protein
MFEMLAQAASNACVAFQNRSAPLPTHSGRSCRSRLIKSSLSVFQPHCFLFVRLARPCPLALLALLLPLCDINRVGLVSGRCRHRCGLPVHATHEKCLLRSWTTSLTCSTMPPTDLSVG